MPHSVSMERRCVASISRFLQAASASLPPSSSAATRKLLDAVQALSEQYSLQPVDYVDDGDPTILDIYVAGCKALDIAPCGSSDVANEDRTRSLPDASGSDDPSAYRRDKSSSANEHAFAKFLARLKTSTDFFKGIEEGTPEYEKRVTRARAKFEAKLAQKREASSGGAAASTEQGPVPATASSVTGIPAVSPEAKQRGDALKAEGNALLGEKKHLEAYEAYGKAIREDSSNAVYYSNRAAALIHLGRFSEAVSDCETAIGLDSNFIRARERLGSAYRHLGMHEREVEALEQAIAIRPDDQKLQREIEAARGRAGGLDNQPAPGSAGLNAGAEALKRMMASSQGQAGQAHGPSGGAPPSGGPDIAAMMNAMGGADGVSGMMNTMASNPAVAQMMNNPSVRQMMADPNLLGELASNPQVAAMMQNPELMSSMMQNFSSMLGGGGAPGSGGGGTGGSS